MGFQSCTNYNLFGICCLLSFSQLLFFSLQYMQASALLKGFLFPNPGIPVKWGGVCICTFGCFPVPSVEFIPIFHCVVGQLRINKSSLRHKVKPIELIFSPPKNNITFCFAKHVFQQPSHKTLVSYGRKSNILQFNNK